MTEKDQIETRFIEIEKRIDRIIKHLSKDFEGAFHYYGKFNDLFIVEMKYGLKRPSNESKTEQENYILMRDKCKKEFEDI